MRTILTGGAGFLGSHIARQLLGDGDQVLALHRRNTNLARLKHLEGEGLAFGCLSADYSNLLQLIEEFEPDNVIHVAAKSRGGESVEEVREYIESNILFGSQLLVAMQNAGVNGIVNAGTSWQWAEDGTYRPFNFYAATKQCFEDIVAHFNQLGVKSINLRVFDTIGVGDDRNRIADLLLDAAITGRSLKMSPGGQNMHIVDIRDAANAFIHCARMLFSLHMGENRVYALRTDPPINLRQLVPLIRDVTGLDLDVEFGGRPYRSRELMYPFAAHAVPPGWSARHLLSETLQEMFAAKRTTVSS